MKRVTPISQVAVRRGGEPTHRERMAIRESDRRRRRIRLSEWLGLFLAAMIQLSWPSAALAQQQETVEPQGSVPARTFQVAPQPGHLFGDWYGVRTQMENAGVIPSVTLGTDFEGNVTGGRARGATAPTSLGVSLLFDLNKLVGLRGGTFMLTGSDRWGGSVSAEYIGNLLAPQQIYGYQTDRLIDASYQQKLFDDKLEIRVGRFATLDDFLVSEYACLFVQLAFCGNPAGLAFDSRGVTGYTGTWAAAAKVKPTMRTSVMAGVFNGDPDIRLNNRHGADLSLRGPAFAIAEAAYQVNGLPEDHSQMLGNYKVGGWYDASTVPDFTTGAPTRGSWGAYGLFDQVLVPFGKPGGNRGLGVFGSIVYGIDPHVQQIPVFANAGVAVRGIFEARPTDTLGLGAAYAKYSEKLPPVLVDPGIPNSAVATQDYEMAFETTYRMNFDKNAIFFQPDLQYILRPGGTGRIRNALVLGFQSGINF